jgi:hypothetical protein
MTLFETLVEALEAREALEEEVRRGVGPVRMVLAEDQARMFAEIFEEAVREIIRDEMGKVAEELKE